MTREEKKQKFMLRLDAEANKILETLREDERDLGLAYAQVFREKPIMRDEYDALYPNAGT